MAQMFEVSQRHGSAACGWSIRPVEVKSIGREYIYVSGGHCEKYRKTHPMPFPFANCSAYIPIHDLSDGKYSSYLFAEQWMAEIYVFKKEQFVRARKVLDAVGIQGLSEAALREIIKCEGKNNG